MNKTTDDFLLISYKVFQNILHQLEKEENGLDAFTSAYTHYGIHVDCRTNDIKVKEWAPGARAMYIRGDFSTFRLFLIISLSIILFNHR